MEAMGSPVLSAAVSLGAELGSAALFLLALASDLTSRDVDARADPESGRRMRGLSLRQ